MKRTVDFAWIVVLSLVAQLALNSPGPAAAMSLQSGVVQQPALGLSDTAISVPAAVAASFVLPTHFLFPVSASGPVSAARAVNGLDAAGADPFMWALPAASAGDAPGGPSVTTDESGAYRFVGLPKGTHKVTLDLSTLSAALRPGQGDESPVLWVTPGMEQISRALSTGVRFTATYDRESGDIYGVVFRDLDGDGRLGEEETGLAGVRVIDPTLHQYLVPFDDRNLWTMFEAKAQCHNPQDRACGPMVSRVFVTAGRDGTVYYYDHWEDGYDADPLIPGPTTAVGVLDAGASRIFESDIQVAQVGQGPPYYHDGRDRITLVGEDASVVRLANASSYSTDGSCPGGANTNGWLASAWEVPEVAEWGQSYHSVVGEDLQFDVGPADDHDYSGLEVMAWQDGTTITYNDVEVAVLDAGETYFVPGADDGAGGGGVESSDHVEASAPVQVQMMTGACGSGAGPNGNLRVSANGYTLLPESSWGLRYWAPVPGFDLSCNPDNVDVDTDIYIHNPDVGNSIDVTISSGAAVTTITIAPHTSVSVLDVTGWADLATGNQGTFLSSDSLFWGLVVADSSTNELTGADDWDCGYSLLPESKLSSQVVIGYGPGRPEGRTDLVNGNMAFVVAVDDTVVFVDLNQDGLADPFDMDGDGELNTQNVWGVAEWDEPVSALGVPVLAGQVLRVSDPFDYELGGARIYTRALEEHIAVAWGQDPCRATYLDYLDLGYTVLASPVPRLSKTDDLAIDADDSGGFSPGDTITYTLVLYNNGRTAMNNVVLTDSLPYTYTDFIAGSLQVTTPPPIGSIEYYNGVSWGTAPVADAQQFRVTWPAFNSEDVVTITFRAYLQAGIPPAVTEVDNRAVVVSDNTEPVETEVRTPVRRPLLSIDKIATPSTVSPGGRITYTLVISNYGDGVALSTAITDVLPSWVEYVPGTLSLQWPTVRAETVTESVTKTTFFHGTYADDFDLSAAETTHYGGNDGALNWTTDWVEVNDDGAPATGQVQVRMDGNALSAPAHLWMGPGPAGSVSGVERTMDLSLFQAPIVRYYPFGPASNTTNDAYIVTVNGATLDSATYAGNYAVQELGLSAYAGQSAVRLGFMASGLMDAGDLYRFDHISLYESDADRIEQTELSYERTTIEYRAATGLDPVSYDPISGGMVLTDGVRLPAGGFITATFEVQVAIPLTDGLELPNTACVSAINWLVRVLPSCDTETVIVQADHILELIKEVEPPAATAGELLTYTLSYRIAGDEAVETMVVSDTTPLSTTFVSASPPPLSQPAVGATGAVVWELEGLWPEGSGVTEVSGTLTMTVRVDMGVISGTLIPNTAVITDSAGLTDTGSVTVPVSSYTDLAIVKTGVPDPVLQEGAIQYTLVYSNLGPSEAVNVFITDTLPAEVTYGGVVEQPDGWTDPPDYDLGPPATLTWYTPTLAVGASGRMVFTVTVNSGVLGTITNSVVISTTTPETRYDNNRDDWPTRVLDEIADVTIQKSDDVDPVQPGGRLVYTLQYRNNGPSPAENVVVSDTLPAEVAFVEANPDRDSGPNPLVWNLGTLAVGQSGTITVAVTVQSWVTQTFTNPVRIDTSTPETDYTNNDDEEPTSVLFADVTIQKADDVDPVQPGGRLVYTLYYRNNGPSPAANVVVSDTLPPEVEFVDATPDQAGGPNPLVWNLGTLAVGQSGTITVAVNVRTWVTQTFTNPVRIDTSTPETDYTNNDDIEPTNVLVTDVTIQKADDVDPVEPGGQLVYTLQYRNNGPYPAVNVRVSDMLPPEVSFVDATPDQSSGPNPLVWNLGTLVVGQQGTLTVTVNVRSWVTQTFTNTVRIFTDTPETDYENNDDDEPTSVPQAADVWIVKTARTTQAAPESTFDYTLEYGNAGSISAENVVVSDTLPPELEFRSAIPEPIPGDERPLVRWNLGTLAPGVGGIITLTVYVRADVTATHIVNVAVITTTTPETRTDNNRSRAEVPTPVQLLYFWGKPLLGAVLLEWGTAWEVDTYGFYLLRSDTGDLADAIEIAFVPAEGRGRGGGAEYSYLDRSIEAGTTYTYWLADVDLDGRRTIHGPVEVASLFLSQSWAPYQFAMLLRPHG